MLKSELIKQNEQLMYLLEFGELRCEDSNHQLIWKHDSNSRVLQSRIERAIKYNKELSELYDVGSMEHSNAITNLLILGDKETTKVLKGEANE